MQRNIHSMFPVEYVHPGAEGDCYDRAVGTNQGIARDVTSLG